MSDDELLRAYATEGSETAFGELVRRHAGAVRAAALRQTANAALAEEVTLAVFLQLARKADSLRSRSVLLGWLLRAARYAAIDAVRAEARRKRHESDYAALQSLASAPMESEPATIWNRVAPWLDEALLRLRPRDRDALLLRFFENKPLAEVGAALGVPEDAARKRVQRALDRLHGLLSRRGATAPLSLLPELLRHHAAPAPAGDFLDTLARAVLRPSEALSSSTSALAAGLGTRLFWAACRPWLVAAGLLGASAGVTFVEWRGPVASVLPEEGLPDDYRPAGFPDARVVGRFVERLQERLGADARNDVAAMMRFPLRVNAARGSETIADREVFLDRYDEIFRPSVIGAVRKCPNRRLFCDRNGVMVGDGTLWIAPVGDPARPEARVISLNLP